MHLKLNKRENIDMNNLPREILLLVLKRLDYLDLKNSSDDPTLMSGTAYSEVGERKVFGAGPSPVRHRAFST